MIGFSADDSACHMPQIWNRKETLTDWEVEIVITKLKIEGRCEVEEDPISSSLSLTVCGLEVVATCELVTVLLGTVRGFVT